MFFTYIVYVKVFLSVHITVYAFLMKKVINLKGRREEYTEATRQALIAAGRTAFATDGYQGTGIEAISRAARVTRGAFYHHFTDKKALFDAVVVAMQTETAAKIEANAKKHRDIWDRLSSGIDAYLDACLDPAYARIVVQEASGVLGSRRYREIDEAHPLALLTATLSALKSRGDLVVEDVSLLSHMVDAMICEVAISLQGAKQPKLLRQRGQKIIMALLDSFRTSR